MDRAQTQPEPAISVIMPIYNVAKWLPQCLDSLAAQTFRDFELLMVEDGSTDNSADIAEAFAQKHAFAKLMRQKNSGAAQARNNAIRVARGKYLAFVDSDDVAHPRYLEKLHAAAVRSDADAVICNYALRLWEHVRIPLPKIRRPQTIPADVALRTALRDDQTKNFLWNKMFRRVLFTDHAIEIPTMRFEDMATVPRLFFYARRVELIPDALYDYRMRPGSQLTVYSRSRVQDAVRAIRILSDFLTEQGVRDAYQAELETLYMKFEHLAVRDIRRIYRKKKQDTAQMADDLSWARAQYEQLWEAVRRSGSTDPAPISKQSAQRS